MARSLSLLVDRSSADRASRLIRGRVAMLIEDIVVAVVVLLKEWTWVGDD